MSRDNWFIKDSNGRERTGVLMRLEEDQVSRYRFEVWFEYTRRAMNEIQEGTMLAVPNYATTREDKHHSILEVTALKPVHYAIGENPDGYPGFVLEAAKNAAQDWTGQDDESTEDTTVIRCTAIPTNLELFEDRDGKRAFREEENMPMVGAIVQVLDTEPTRQVVNRDIDLEAEQELLFKGGTLLQNPDVETFIRVEEFVRVHFAVFGYTGSGKSNLLSTYISYLLEAQEPVKIVLFDLMSEYTGLLIDLLNSGNLEKAHVVALGENTLPGPVVNYLNNTRRGPSASEAAMFMNRVTLLPKRLQRYKPQLQTALESLLRDGNVRVFSEIGNMTIWYLFWDYKNNHLCPLAYKRRTSPQKREQRKTVIKAVLARCVKSPRDYEGKKDYKHILLNREMGEELLSALEEELEKQSNREFREDFDGVIGQITSAIPQLDSISPAALSLNEMISDLNDEESKASLYIVQAHNPDEMRKFVAMLGDELYETRRRSGEILPLVSFIVDEADEFIPLDGGGSYAESRRIIETLARRGRKFGLGVGIATQRARRLDASIMAQPHTYLVSKLPRENDRTAVSDAFGISNEMFRQTFKFKAGNWLLISHDATGLRAIPVPIKTEDANQRVGKYLETLKGQDG